MAQFTERFDHPAWLTAAGTLAGYGLVLLFLFLLLFVVPYLLFPA
jgi:Na+-transporting methylmalonyl-CoA/oxaloacetate decarboxylase gamma subunit